MINTNVQEVCCNQCDARKVVDVPSGVDRQRRISEGWIMISKASYAVGSRDKQDNIISEKWSDNIHFCSVSCVTNFFSKMFEIVRAKCQTANGNPVATVIDPSYIEAQKQLAEKEQK